MAAYQITATAAGATAFIPINLRRFKFGVGLLLNFGTGASGTANVEVTGQALNQGSGSAQGGSPVGTVGPTVWNLHDVLQGLTASKNSSLAYPVTGIRLNMVNLTGGTVTLMVVEAEG